MNRLDCSINCSIQSVPKKLFVFFITDRISMLSFSTSYLSNSPLNFIFRPVALLVIFLVTINVVFIFSCIYITMFKLDTLSSCNLIFLYTFLYIPTSCFNIGNFKAIIQSFCFLSWCKFSYVLFCSEKKLYLENIVFLRDLEKYFFFKCATHCLLNICIRGLSFFCQKANLLDFAKSIWVHFQVYLKLSY